jgi:hypothetical protein
MFDLSALVMLTIFNLIALIQIASNIIVPARLQRGPVLAAAAICLATSLTGLAMAVLVPSTIVGIASITIAALVNLFAVLGTGLDRLSDPSSAEAMNYLRGLARLAIVGAPHDSILPRELRRPAPRPAAPARPATTARSVRPGAQAAPTRDARDPLPKLLAAARQTARPASQARRPATSAPRIPASAMPLTPRQQFSVPRRPNRLPTSSLAFLLSVDPKNEPDIFADARASMSQLSSLARRVSLVASDPRHPSIRPQSSSVWPTTYAQPDPAWRTSYARIPAVAFGV